MSKKTMLSALFTGLLITAGLFSTHDHTVCAGVLPQNDMKIPAFGKLSASSNISEEVFNEVLDEIEDYYGPVIEARGKTLVVERLWENTTVNARARQQGNTYYIDMFGGLARHPEITRDGFQLVACHEIGHHLAGAPKISGWFSPAWASNEGQSDYFSTLRCTRFMWGDEDNASWVAEHDIDEYAQGRCREIYNTQEDEDLCTRTAMAGLSLASLFKDLKDLPSDLLFETPDESAVGNTDDCHPEPQCRLDTYFQGALCVSDLDGELSDRDPLQGACNTETSHTVGTRPSCWYKYGTDGDRSRCSPFATSSDSVN